MSYTYDSAAVLLPRADDYQCQTARAADYYGLGVRLGVYFAWFQAYIANTSLKSEIASALDTNAMFLLTILIAMIKCTSVGMLGAMDGLILMHLSGGTIFGILSIWGYRTRQYFEDGHRGITNFGGFGSHGRLIISLAVSIYGLWFWMYGITGTLHPMGPPEDLEEPNPPQCDQIYTFMFSPVPANGGIRYFYIVICILCTIYFSIMLLTSPIALWARIRRMKELARSSRWADTSRLPYSTGFKYSETAIIFKTLRILNLLWLIFSILLVEFTLNYNRASAVLGGPHENELHLPAQLLPLLIGSFGFIRICYLRFEDFRNRGDPKPSIPDDEPDTPRKSRTMHFGPQMLQAFSPAMAADNTRQPHDPDEIGKKYRMRSRAVRYLVAWLPWLSLLGNVEEPESPERGEKRISGASGAETLRE